MLGKLEQNTGKPQEGPHSGKTLEMPVPTCREGSGASSRCWLQIPCRNCPSLKSSKRQCQAQLHSLAWAQLSTAQIYPEAEGGNLSVTDAGGELLMEWKRSRECSRASWICPSGSTSVISKLTGHLPGPHFHLALGAELIKDG